MEKETIKPKHSVNLMSRKRADMTGITKVLSAENNVVVLETSDGKLEMRGSGLQISDFSEADATISISGKIDKLEYADAKPPLLKRLFK